MKLQDGAKIAVVGGGPAGSFFAYHILSFARRLGKKFNVVIYDGKPFAKHGPAGCNMCAGTLSSNLLDLLKKAGYRLPDNVVRQDITGYTFHFKNKSVILSPEKEGRIVTVYRGMGPCSVYRDKVSFDQYLLDTAVSCGAEYRNRYIDKIIMPPAKGEKITLQCGNNREDFDLTAGAFGVNSRLSVPAETGYRPPKSWSSCQVEIEAGEDFVKAHLENNIHVFNIEDPQIKFIALVPKRNFISVSIIGPHVRIRDAENVLGLSEFREFLPAGWSVRCHCHPKIPVSSAKHPYADRLVITGDACNSRYLKNGIESAFQTAREAAHTAAYKGVSAYAMRRHYYTKSRNMFNLDNMCGRIIFGMNNLISSSPHIAERFIDFTIREKDTQPKELRLTGRILWNMFTGNKAYKDILTKGLHPRVITKILPQILGGLFSGKKHHCIYKVMKIGIVGGGPAGASCAIKLLSEAEKLGRKIKVIIFEGKDFKRHYNQCVGVLSPPLEEILREELGITLPPELIKRTITGYKLHGNTNVLTLSETGRYHTYTVRRVKFDKFLLDTAVSRGAQIINSRVTNIEFIDEDEVRIYCESGYQKVDVIIAASGTDDTMLNELEYATRGRGRFHRPKRFLSTIITKIHTDPSFITERLGNYVHAFLLSALPKIEFGAITPKMDHIIINIAGKNITSLDMDRFLRQKQVKALLPEINFDGLEYFKGKFPISGARNPWGNRFAAVGDVTGWMRPFKGKGVNTAVYTGIKAAETIMQRGISRRDFTYYEKACKKLTEDYRYGFIARSVSRVCRTSRLFDTVIETAKADISLYDALYQCISGEMLYKKIFRNIFNPRLLCRLFVQIIREKL